MDYTINAMKTLHVSARAKCNVCIVACKVQREQFVKCQKKYKACIVAGAGLQVLLTDSNGWGSGGQCD